MIVVDTNVIAYLLIPGDSTALAEELWRREPEWCAPVLWRSELRSVLVSTMRRGEMELEIAAQIAEKAEDLIGAREFVVPSVDVLRRAVQSRCSAYDCEFVVLAERLAVSLVTTDRQVLAAFPKLARSPAKFLA